MTNFQSETITQAVSPNQTAIAASPDTALYTPKDLATTWKLLAVTSLGNTLIAGFFIPYLPLWMPLTWLVLALSTGGAQLWCATRPVLQPIPFPLRLQVERSVFWFSQACMGSAAFFLYVPGNLGMLGVLNVCVVVIGALSVLQFSGDHWRGAVGCALGILPTATRYFFEDSWLLVLLGLGGYIVVLALSMFGHMQYLALIEQAALRKRAEDAADAVAAVGLSKARFFAAVSHDLRQPVHAIGLYLASLQSSVTDSRSKKGIDGITQAWQALDGLLSQVLDLTRMDSGSLQAELSAVELEPLIRGLVVQHSAAAERKSIRIVALVKPRCYMLADMLMLKRVLSNLLDNAIKFSPEDARIVIALRSAGTHWCVQVRDHGPGIALVSQEKVFEEFVQLDNPARNRAQGLGLGLAIAQRFVSLMQGHLRLRSAPTAGTCMGVYLPKVLTASAEAANYTQPAQVVLKIHVPSTLLNVHKALRAILRDSGKSILMVEDDALVVQAMTQLFSDLNLPILYATNASQALELAPQACMVACDVRLPGSMSGLDLALRLKHMAIPTLLMTGETSADIKAFAHHHGLQLLIKPVAPQVLLNGLKELVVRTVPATAT
jgi:two-component system, sensor histidine kinase